MHSAVTDQVECPRLVDETTAPAIRHSRPCGPDLRTSTLAAGIAAADYALAPGLSLHLFGGRAGLYGTRIESGRGFAEMPAQDLLTLHRFLQGDEGQQLVRALESLNGPALPTPSR